jgi:hypothetical protein
MLMSLGHIKFHAGDKCEAQFHSGEWYILQNKLAEAQVALQKAVEICPKALSEYTGARAALQRLKPQQGGIQRSDWHIWLSSSYGCCG